MFIKNSELKVVKTVNKEGENINLYQYKNTKQNNKFYICIESICDSPDKGLSNRYAEFENIEEAICEAELFLDMIKDVRERKIV